MTRLQVNALKRVLSNLIENAVAYSSGQEVTLECSCSGADTVIRVIDRGPGIPESERENIFQPFHRLENSRSKSTGGSGLGLAIVRQLCRANGWGIETRATAGGSGSIFELRLPGAR